MSERIAHIRLVEQEPADSNAEGLTDAALAVAAQAEEAWSQRAIWERYSVPIRRLLDRSLGPGHDIDDLVQDVFLRLFRKLDALRDPAALRSFIFAIAMNTVRLQIRRAKLRRLVSSTGDSAVTDGVSSAADPKMQLAIHRLYGILDRMRISHREVFVLRYLQGFQLTEISQITNNSLSTVKRRLDKGTQFAAREAASDPILAEYLSALSAGRSLT